MAAKPLLALEALERAVKHDDDAAAYNVGAALLYIAELEAEREALLAALNKKMAAQKAHADRLEIAALILREAIRAYEEAFWQDAPPETADATHDRSGITPLSAPDKAQGED